MSLQPKLASNPLQDDELSDVTKREIKFWANKLKVTPSQLFSLTKGELDTLLESVIHGENSQPQQHDKQAERSERLSKMKQKLLEGNEKDRLKGGLDLLELLCHAAQDIENYLCGQANDQTYDVDDTDFTESSGEETPTYEPSCPRAASTPISCGPRAASTPISCGPAAASTPYGNDTYTVGGQNATYNVGGQNATYNVPQNATYNVPQNATYNVPQNATFNVPQNATYPIECPNATYNVGGPNATYNVESSSPRGGPVAASTPYGITDGGTFTVGGQNATYNVPQNATYNVPQNATYNVSPQNATFTVSPQNATYNVAQDNTYCVQPAGNATYDISPSLPAANASAFRPLMESTPYHIRSPHEATPYTTPPTPTPPSFPAFSGQRGSSGASRPRGSQPSPGRCVTRTLTPSSGASSCLSGGAYGGASGGANATQICPAPSSGDWAPQAMNFIGDQDNRTFRNYTDYAITYGPSGSAETANSISVESFDDFSGQVTASSRTFSLPPACSPTDALALSRISPPVLASGAGPGSSPGAARARSPLNQSNVSTTSPPSLASGCTRSPLNQTNLSTMTPINLASGCTRSPQRSTLSGVSPPSLASGAGGRMSPRECSPSPLRQQSPGRNPHLMAALRATTPMRVKPNRPYRPRRIC